MVLMVYTSVYVLGGCKETTSARNACLPCRKLDMHVDRKLSEMTIKNYSSVSRVRNNANNGITGLNTLTTYIAHGAAIRIISSIFLDARRRGAVALTRLVNERTTGKTKGGVHHTSLRRLVIWLAQNGTV